MKTTHAPQFRARLPVWRLADYVRAWGFDHAGLVAGLRHYYTHGAWPDRE